MERGIRDRRGPSGLLQDRAKYYVAQRKEGREVRISKKATRRRQSRPGLEPQRLARLHLDTIASGLGSSRAAARILGVSPSQLTRWRQDQAPDAENADRLAGLALVMEMLLRWLEPEAVEGWLEGPNAHLGDRSPAYLLKQGQVADVIGAIEAGKAGVYA
jgi:uncharacterized protein (DUF2384 family)